LKVALLLILIFIIYLTSVTFFELPAAGREVAKTVVPYFLGVITILVGFYWGNSHKTNEPELLPNTTTIDMTAIVAAVMNEMKRIAAAKVEADKVEAERIKAAEIEAAKVIETAKLKEGEVVK
jgi:hypothetical protein